MKIKNILLTIGFVLFELYGLLLVLSLIASCVTSTEDSLIPLVVRIISIIFTLLAMYMAWGCWRILKK